MGSTNLLEVEGLSTSFHTAAGKILAVDDVAFSLKRGQVMGLVGESGSGKSVTAMSIMNLVDSPGKVTARRLDFDGISLTQASARQWGELRGNRIALVSQDPMMSLNPVMRVGAQLCETIRIHRKVSASDAQTMACEALRRVGIPAPAERMKAYPHELSGGMRQRVAIANALVNQPDLIIADEPTTALDVTIQAQILYEMRKLTRESGTALLWITHDLAVVKDLADHLCVMYAGRLVEQGPVEELIRAPRHPYTRGLLDSLPHGRSAGGRLKPIPGNAPSLANLPQGCTFSPRCSRATAQCQKVPVLAKSSSGSGSYRCFNPL
jgi:peptide/nickel transport system ATP-binding protein